MDRLHSGTEVVETLNRYSRKLEKSGYSARSRADIICASIKTYWNIRKDEDEGHRPLYRSKSWCEREREMEKQNKKSSWSKNGKTPREIARVPLIISPLARISMTLLMKVCRKFATEHNIHVKVVMRGGNKMSREIKSNPLRVGCCHRNDCMVCMTGSMGDCSGMKQQPI